MAKKEITPTAYKAQIIDMVLKTENVAKLKVIEIFIENYLGTKPKVKIDDTAIIKVCAMKMLDTIKSEQSMLRISSYIQFRWMDEEWKIIKHWLKSTKTKSHGLYQSWHQSKH